MPRDLHIFQMPFIMALKSPRINGMRRWIIWIIIIPSIIPSNINIVGTFLSNLIVVIIFFSVVKTKPNMRDVGTASLKWVKFAFKESQSEWHLYRHLAARGLRFRVIYAWKSQPKESTLDYKIIR
jgi:hypothetical protein